MFVQERVKDDYNSLFDMAVNAFVLQDLKGSNKAIWSK